MHTPHSVSASRLAGLVALISAGALLAACAPAPPPQESGYQLWNVVPAVAPPFYARGQYDTRPDYGDPVIAAPAPTPAPPPEQKTAEAQPAPAPAPVAPTPGPSNRSPTCGAWRLGCGILWQ